MKYLQHNSKCPFAFQQIISNVALTLELAVPLIRHPSEVFLSQLEEDAVKLIMQHDKKVVSACLSLLGSVVNNVTKVQHIYSISGYRVIHLARKFCRVDLDLGNFSVLCQFPQNLAERWNRQCQTQPNLTTWTSLYSRKSFINLGSR